MEEERRRSPTKDSAIEELKKKLESIQMTKKEESVILFLVKAWNSYCSLPGRNPAEDSNFFEAIHHAEHCIALRVARRVDPKIWV